MSRTSVNTVRDGFNYDVQAWYQDGRWVACNHPLTMDCGCFSREHAGEIATPDMRGA
jgi:hypothetical protein